MFRLEPGQFREPVLVSSADGVGTKLKVAFLANRHDTIGADLVNHCVNDILVQGAEPLFFLDYLATGRLLPDVAESIISGIAAATASSCKPRMRSTFWLLIVFCSPEDPLAIQTYPDVN